MGSGDLKYATVSDCIHRSRCLCHVCIVVVADVYQDGQTEALITQDLIGMTPRLRGVLVTLLRYTTRFLQVEKSKVKVTKSHDSLTEETP